MQNEKTALPDGEKNSPSEEPKVQEEKKVRTLGEILTFLTDGLGTRSRMPDRVTKKGTMMFYHQPKRRRTLRKMQECSRQINARKAKG
jgi:hypothetical protein